MPCDFFAALPPISFDESAQVIGNLLCARCGCVHGSVPLWGWWCLLSYTERLWVHVASQPVQEPEPQPRLCWVQNCWFLLLLNNYTFSSGGWDSVTKGSIAGGIPTLSNLPLPPFPLITRTTKRPKEGCPSGKGWVRSILHSWNSGKTLCFALQIQLNIRFYWMHMQKQQKWCAFGICTEKIQHVLPYSYIN